MGYWLSYIGVGLRAATLRPYFNDGGVLLFSPPVVVASLLVPALALARLRVDAALALRPGSSSAGPGRRCWSWSPASRRGPRCAAALTFAYNHFDGVAVPAHDLQGRARWWRWGSPAWAARRPPRRGARLRAAAGRARRARRRRSARPARRSAPGRWCAGARVDAQMSSDRVPAAWTHGGARPRPHAARNERARWSSPGQLYALLPLGRDRRPGPARAHRTGRWRRASSALRRPARRRPAVDGRRADLPAAGAARAARAAAGPARGAAR